MGVFEWSLLGLIVIGVAPAVARLAFGHLSGLSVDITLPRWSFAHSNPRRLLRSEIRARGGDVRRIPRAALDEIVGQKARLAEELAATQLSSYVDKRATLMRELRAEAAVIVRLLRGERLIRGAEESFDTLVKHGVLKP